MRSKDEAREGKLDCNCVCVCVCHSLISSVYCPSRLLPCFYSSVGDESSRHCCEASLQQGQLKPRKMGFVEKHTYTHESVSPDIVQKLLFFLFIGLLHH